MPKFFIAALAVPFLLGLAPTDGAAQAATRAPHVGAGSAITQVHQPYGHRAPHYVPPRHAHRHYAPPPPRPRHYGWNTPPHRPYRQYGWR
nr:hypothetical protein [uncultured Roseococcus sp.]